MNNARNSYRKQDSIPVGIPVFQCHPLANCACFGGHHRLGDPQVNTFELVFNGNH